MLSYGGRAAEIWWQQSAGKLANQKNLRVLSLSADEGKALAGLAERGMRLQCTVQDGVVWLGSDSQHLEIVPRILLAPDSA